VITSISSEGMSEGMCICSLSPVPRGEGGGEGAAFEI
jgi:hypothetical protein